jgi:hypothetical protein
MASTQGWQRIRGQLGQLRSLVELEGQAQRTAPAISGWSVAEHVEHLARAHSPLFVKLAELTESDDPALAHGRVTLVGLWVLWTGRIPRGRGKAPERTRPTAGSLQQVRGLIGESSDAFERLATRRAELERVRARIDHPYFGRLLPKHWLRFVELHHEHHLAIVREILDQG